MIFQETWQQVLTGNKMVTRRLAKPNDEGPIHPQSLVNGVYRNGRLLWKRGRTYAVQPGRGRKSVGRIYVTNLYREPLTAIMNYELDEISCEGFVGLNRLNEFIDTWDKLNPRHKFFNNPYVWVIRFVLVSTVESEGE